MLPLEFAHHFGLGIKAVRDTDDCAAHVDLGILRTLGRSGITDLAITGNRGFLRAGACLLRLFNRL